MPYIQYIEKKLSEERLVLIDLVNKIVQEYSDKGFDLTVRTKRMTNSRGQLLEELNDIKIGDQNGTDSRKEVPGS